MRWERQKKTTSLLSLKQSNIDSLMDFNRVKFISGGKISPQSEL